MLDLIALSLFAGLNIWGQNPERLEPLELFPWHDSAIFKPPAIAPDLEAEDLVRNYLQKLIQTNSNRDRQGIWLQSDWDILAENQGTIALPAASLTKIATTLAALAKWGANHQFKTDIYVTGEIVGGVVRGDLIVVGSGDPLFVWEEAIALGNTLNQLGIKQIAGDLAIADKFYMNYQDEPASAGKLLKQSFNPQQWQTEITQQYLQMPPGTLQPEIAIAGKVKVIPNLPPQAKLIVSHQSLPLAEILRQMNIYSNNQMAQILTDLLGGAETVAKSSADLGGFPPEEIQLINGSGLGEANRISPRAVCQMLMTLERLLNTDSLAVTDLFPTSSRDLVGTVQNRNLPPGTTIKTGTLDRVSALAGVVPTADRGNIYFSIINYGRQYQYFRQQQDWLITELSGNWQLADNNFDGRNLPKWFLGNPQRNIIIRAKQ